MPLVPAARWKDTAVKLPPEQAGKKWRNVLTGEPVTINDGAIETGPCPGALPRRPPRHGLISLPLKGGGSGWGRRTISIPLLGEGRRGSANKLPPPERGRVGVGVYEAFFAERPTNCSAIHAPSIASSIMPAEAM